MELTYKQIKAIEKLTNTKKAMVYEDFIEFQNKKHSKDYRGINLCLKIMIEYDTKYINVWHEADDGILYESSVFPIKWLLPLGKILYET